MKVCVEEELVLYVFAGLPVSSVYLICEFIHLVVGSLSHTVCFSMHCLPVSCLCAFVYIIHINSFVIFNPNSVSVSSFRFRPEEAIRGWNDGWQRPHKKDEEKSQKRYKEEKKHSNMCLIFGHCYVIIFKLAKKSIWIWRDTFVLFLTNICLILTL